MPKNIIDSIKFGRERFVLADTVVRLTEEFRNDYVPGEKMSDAFDLLLILRRMYEVHQRGRESSAVSLERSTGIPRTSVNRKLKTLVKIGAVEQRDHRYVLVPAFLNTPHLVTGFERRRDLWHRADGKMITVVKP